MLIINSAILNNKNVKSKVRISKQRKKQYLTKWHFLNQS